MSGDACKTVTLNGVIVQENNILRNAKGRLIARCIDDAGFDTEHIQDGNVPTEREKALWALLDNVDTASDMFKPTDLTGYRTFYDYVLKQAAFRHNHLTSDGHHLYLPGMEPVDTSKPETPSS